MQLNMKKGETIAFTMSVERADEFMREVRAHKGNRICITVCADKRAFEEEMIE